MKFSEWLQNWRTEYLVIAEGYIWEFEKRGYIASGSFSPDFILKYPERVRMMIEDFVYAGSDVALALQYYAHRRKMEEIGMEDICESVNKKALQIAKEVAESTGTIFAGGLSNTLVQEKISDKAEQERLIEEIFREQIQWNIDAGVEYVLAETLSLAMEGRIAAKLCKEMGVPVAVLFNLYNHEARTLDGVPVEEACRLARESGADVVGVNCGFGPQTILPVVRRIRATVGPDCPLAAVPCGYRTTEERPSWMQIMDPRTGLNAYFEDLGHSGCNLTDIQEFAAECMKLGVTYMGICCGNYGSLTRRMAETVGKTPAASENSGRRDRIKECISTWCGPQFYLGVPARPGREGEENPRS